ncbi:hypothetical protein AAFF_G00103120 [Aldrovandia affinis]|uniref:Uncharacterized protein n=1 Tax=Aldrovandia affinis TaxID=143900 RepID=A0AAD7RUL0_9TELE|nr:hypothetical protein AAFF_G00103120 [Aldrovandia affinis]
MPERCSPARQDNWNSNVARHPEPLNRPRNTGPPGNPREAKRLYGLKLSSHFKDNQDSRRLWQGFNTIADNKPPPQASHTDPTLPDRLNDFYARFEAKNSNKAQMLPPSPSEQIPQVTAAEVKKVFASVNPRKAAGPDNIPGVW